MPIISLVIAVALALLFVEAHSHAEKTDLQILNKAVISHKESPKVRQPVELPHDWHRLPPEFNMNSYGAVDYELAFTVEGDFTGIYALYFPFVNAAIEASINGRKIQGLRAQSKEGRTLRFWNRPQMVLLSNDSLRNKNQLNIRLFPKFHLHARINEIYFGEYSAIEHLYKAAYFKRIIASQISFFTVLLFCTLISFFFFSKTNREETLFLVLSCISWCVYCYDLFMINPPIDGRLWDAVIFASLGAFPTFMLFFLWRYFDYHNTFLERFVVGGWCLGAIVLFTISEENIFLFTDYVWNAWLVIVGLYQYAFVLQRTFSKPKATSILLATSITILVACGIHDFFLQLYSDWVFDFRLLSIGMTIHIFVLLLVRSNQHLALMEQYESLNKNLETRVEEKTQEISLQYEQLRMLEKERARSDEREHMLREIHDGIGGKLVSILAQMENMKIPGSPLGLLKDAIAELRFILDASHVANRSLDDVLGAIRPQIDRMLANTEIKLIWQIENAGQSVSLSPAHALGVARIVQEAITNCIKHSRANQVVVSCHDIDHGASVEISVINDGLATDFRGRGHGMHNMRTRALEIGAKIKFVCDDRGVGVVLTISRDGHT